MTKLSNLNSAAVLNASDLVYVVQNGVSLKATVAQISVGAILTAGRVPFMGGLGVLTDSANLTFAGSALSVSGSVGATYTSSVAGVVAQFGTANSSPLAYVGSISADDFIFIRGAVEKARIVTTGLSTVTLTASTSVVTPRLLINSSADASDIQPRITLYSDPSNWGYLSYGASTILTFVVGKTGSNSTLRVGTTSANDGTGTFTTGGVQAAFIDTGTTTSLLLKTNSGSTQAKIVSAGDGTNFASIQGGSSPFSPVIFSNGGDTNIGLIFSSKGTGSVDITTGGTFSGDINSGRQLQARFAHTANTVNFLNHTGGTTGQSPFIQALGSDTNIGIRIIALGTGAIVFEAPGGTTQFSVLGTASSTRNITVTGSNGGNPTLGVTAGSLAITPAVVIAGANLQIGTTPASVATAGIGLPFASALTARKSDNSGDIEVIATSTLNSVVNIVTVGTAQTSGASAGVLLRGRSGAGVPVAADIPSGTWALWRDTSGATTKIYYNNAGTIQATAAFT